MKKFFAIAAALLIGVAAIAQETNKDENGNYKYGGYETNKFGQNWFVGGGVGLNTQTSAPYYILGNLFGKNGLEAGNFFSVDGLFVEGFVGKWFSPEWGTRVVLGGLNMATPTAGGDASQSYFAGHVDLLVNASNLIWGYKEDRCYNLIPYVAAGAAKGHGYTPIAGVGILNQFMFSPKFGLYLDLRLLGDEYKSFYGAANEAANLGGIYSASLGLNFNLGTTNWTRVSTTAAAAAAAIAAANAAKAAAEAKVAGAQKAASDAEAAAKNAQSEAAQLVDEAKKAAGTNVDGLFDEPVVVYFTIGKSTLSKTEKAHAEYAIKNIISRGENVKFTLNGSADTGTGSKKRNEQLSKERAQTVYNLVDELGVSRENITVVEWDGTERFATPELNRAVIIEKQ